MAHTEAYKARRQRYLQSEKGKAFLTRKRRRQKEENQKLIVEKKSRPCLDCGVSYPPWVMDFHHRPGEVKRFGIGRGAAGRTRSAILAEIDKCDVLCANCHRLRHPPECAE